MSPRRVVKAFFLNLVAVVLIIFVAGPFLWVAVASLQAENDLLHRPPSVLQHPTLDNYNYVFTGKIPLLSLDAKEIRPMRDWGK